MGHKMSKSKKKGAAAAAAAEAAAAADAEAKATSPRMQKGDCFPFFPMIDLTNNHDGLMIAILPAQTCCASHARVMRSQTSAGT